MFDIGFQELIMVFIVALFVVEPGKLPEVSRKLAKWINIIRGGINEVTTHVGSELKGLGLKREDDVRSLIRKIDAASYSQEANLQKDTKTEEKGGA